VPAARHQAAEQGALGDLLIEMERLRIELARDPVEATADPTPVYDEIPGAERAGRVNMPFNANTSVHRRRPDGIPAPA
jgi:hypothetical protein